MELKYPYALDEFNTMIQKGEAHTDRDGYTFFCRVSA